MVVGQLDLTTLDTNEEIISVFQIDRFEQYNATYQFNDVALLKVFIFRIADNKLFKSDLLNIYHSCPRIST